MHADKRIDIITTDPDNNHVLECAVKAGSDVIVSGDTDADARELCRMDIVKASDFVVLLENRRR